LELTDTEWRVLFRPPQPGVHCGLLRSRIDVDPVARRRCRVTVHDRDTDEFRGSFVIRARVERVRADVDRRMTALDRAGEVTAAVEDGQWWRDARRFHDLGWARTASVAGIRCPGGAWGTDVVVPTRWTKVLDVGPAGVTLRGWRTRTVLPWETVAGIEVDSDRDPYSREGAGRTGARGRAVGGATVRVRSGTGDELAFHTGISSAAEITTRLRPFQDQLTRSSTVRPPVPVPELNGR
jgi:hypothetical protein